ncbi:MAG: universal stress protein [Rhodothermales bacterium]|nr:universal stress protein [Rhodothermales bacterium]
MEAPRPILVPTDLSEAAERALRCAVAWSRSDPDGPVPIHLLHVLDIVRSEVPAVVSDAVGAAPFWEQLEGAYGRELARLAETYGESVPITTEQRRDAAVVATIADVARETAARFIVMGTHGRQGVGRLLLGSVAEEVVRQAPCDVVVTHEGGRDGCRLRRIVVPVDFSAASLRMLEQAKALAARHDGEVDLVHVFEEPVLPVLWPGPGVVQDLLPKLRDRATVELERLRARAGGPDVPVRAVLEIGHAAAGVLDHAAATGADLIVMASHGYRGLGRFLLGSVAERVVREAPCPVYVHRMEPGEEAEAEHAAATPEPGVH